MILYNKILKQPEEIYGVQNDTHGYPMFLVYRNNQWVWRSAKHFKPMNQRTVEERIYDEIIEQINNAKTYIKKGD